MTQATRDIDRFAKSGIIVTEDPTCKLCGGKLEGSDIVVHATCLTLKQIESFEKFSLAVDRLVGALGAVDAQNRARKK